MSILGKTATSSLFVTYAFLTSSCVANPPQPINIPENYDAPTALETPETDVPEPTSSRAILNSPKKPSESTDTPSTPEKSDDNCFRLNGRTICPRF